MARENTVMLHGQLFGNPQIYVTKKDGTPAQAAFVLKVLRRPFLNGEGQNNMSKLRADFPSIITKDSELIKLCATLREGDMVDIKGVLTTRDVVKKSSCHNGHAVETLGTHVFVTPIYICQREESLSPEKGDMLLRQRCEISNIAMIIGTLCREPVFYEHSDEGSCMTQYQIASNRRYHIRDGHEEERTDYPWVKTVNRQGRDDMEHLRLNSTIFINGAIQTREINKSITCPECGERFERKEMVSELFPYSVEYLSNCAFPEKKEPEKFIKEVILDGKEGINGFPNKFDKQFK